MPGDFRQDHLASVEAAHEAVDVMQQTINALILQAQRAATAVAMATGGNASLSESGREAFEFASAFEDDARRQLDRTTLCKASLVAYRNAI